MTAYKNNNWVESGDILESKQILLENHKIMFVLIDSFTVTSGSFAGQTHLRCVINNLQNLRQTINNIFPCKGALLNLPRKDVFHIRNVSPICNKVHVLTNVHIF